MKASIVTPSYNSLVYLKNTLSALEKQDIGFENFEVVVIDDGSTDGTTDFIKSYKGNLNLNSIINPKNLGRAKSRNIGITNSKNELIIFLDSDIEVKPDFVSLHLQHHINGEIACVGKVRFHPEIKRNSFMKYLDSRGAAKYTTGERIPGQYFRTTNASVTKKLLMEIGCFDENFTHYGGEDAEIGMRIADKIPIIALTETIGYNRHIRSLEDTLKIIHEYGEFSIPYLLKKQPTLARELRVQKGFSNLFYEFICFYPFYKFIKFLANVNFVPSSAYSYLLMCSYRNGYFRHQRKL